eukprot:9383373-Alexandrium_andersonii.AAC.1
MSASLVGSEMCIRDSTKGPQLWDRSTLGTCSALQALSVRFEQLLALPPVSYTHLTLPTICSV